MAVLLIEVPDRPSRVVDLPLDRAFVVGRNPGCDLILEDTTVSGRHLRIAPLEGGDYLVQDLGSTHGTLLGKRRTLRSVLAFGDVLLLGKSRVTVLERAPEAPPGSPEAPLVGGTLDLRPVGAGPSSQPPSFPYAPPPSPTYAPPPSDATAPAPVGPPPSSAASEAAGDPALASFPATESPAPPPEVPQARLVRPVDARSMGRAVAIVVVGALVLVGAEFLLRPQADRARERAEERRDLREALGKMDISPDTFQMEVEDFLADHPQAPEAESLLRYVAAIQAREGRRLKAESELTALTAGLHDLPESEVRERLLALQRARPGDEDVARRVRLHLDLLNRRHEESEQAALAAAVRAAEARVAAHDPAGALRRLTAFRAAWPSLAPEALDRLRTVEDQAIAAADGLMERSLAEAEAESDARERRRILGSAWRGLAGTPQGERIADALRFTRGPVAAGATPGRTPAAVPPVEEPGVETGLLAKASTAESLFRERSWDEAAALLRELLEAAPAGLLREEWLARARELDWIRALVQALGTAAAGEAPPQVRLHLGKATVKSAGPTGVEILVGEETKRLAWKDVADEDLLPLLTPAKPTPEQRLGLAALAAGLSRKEDFVRLLAPLLEQGGSAPEASRMVARYLYGRSDPPPEGYRVHQGEILDKAGYERRRKAEEVAALRDRAEDLLTRVSKDPAFKKLEKLKELRTELDKRRRHALLAIFDETHYPYPYDRASPQYREVQAEIDRRVAAVREIWDDPHKVKIGGKGSLARLFEDWDGAIAAMGRLEADVGDLVARMEAFSLYVTDEPITVREYFKDPAERRLLAYNRWVVDTYNPGQMGEATEAERRQTVVTNEYRIMLGYAAVVTPGPAPYDAIDGENVAKILDEGRIERLVPLRAVRVDDRLVRSARGHSQDMQRRGFFNHFAPPNPATGAPRTSPFDRMQKAGYGGGGASENIANGASSPEEAHAMWCHSSGHHRNILSPWHDQGVGQAGRLWTQNYGIGGGAAPTIGGEAAPAEGEGGFLPRPPEGEAPPADGGGGAGEGGEPGR